MPMEVQCVGGVTALIDCFIREKKKSRADCTGALGPVWTGAEDSPTSEFDPRSAVRIASRHTD